jgi:hypothetical protein
MCANYASECDKQTQLSIVSLMVFITNIVRVIKSKRMRWAGHVARMGWKEACIEFWWGNLGERDHLGDPGVDGRVILYGSSGSGMLGYGLD